MIGGLNEEQEKQEEAVSRGYVRSLETPRCAQQRNEPAWAEEAKQEGEASGRGKEAPWLTVLVIPTDCQVSSSTRRDIFTDSYLGLQISLRVHAYTLAAQAHTRNAR